MNAEVLRELCHAHGFSLEMHQIPSTSKEDAYLVILVPTSMEDLDLKSRKGELNLLKQKLIELCPAIEQVTIQCGSD
jgi:hypothetical protein